MQVLAAVDDNSHVYMNKALSREMGDAVLANSLRFRSLQW